jgi:hypothetical protein
MKCYSLVAFLDTGDSISAVHSALAMMNEFYFDHHLDLLTHKLTKIPFFFFCFLVIRGFQ